MNLRIKYWWDRNTFLFCLDSSQPIAFHVTWVRRVTELKKMPNERINSRIHLKHSTIYSLTSQFILNIGPFWKQCHTTKRAEISWLWCTFWYLIGRVFMCWLFITCTMWDEVKNQNRNQKIHTLQTNFGVVLQFLWNFYLLQSPS